MLISQPGKQLVISKAFMLALFIWVVVLVSIGLSIHHGSKESSQHLRNICCICDKERATWEVSLDPVLGDDQQYANGIVSTNIHYSIRISYHDASESSQMQISATLTLGCRFIARPRSSAVMLYCPKLASVSAMTKWSSRLWINEGRLGASVD